MDDAQIEDQKVKQSKLRRASLIAPILVLAVGGGILLALSPVVNEYNEREQEFKSAFTSTYDVQDASRSKFGFTVTLTDGTQLTCKNMSLDQVKAREPVKCAAKGGTEHPLTLEAK